MIGIARCWMGVGSVYPAALTPLTMGAGRPRRVNGIQPPEAKGEIERDGTIANFGIPRGDGPPSATRPLSAHPRRGSSADGSDAAPAQSGPLRPGAGRGRTFANFTTAQAADPVCSARPQSRLAPHSEETHAEEPARSPLCACPGRILRIVRFLRLRRD